MGTEIASDRFEESDYQRFEERLRDCLLALNEVLRRPSFGEGEPTIGAELEMHLVDAAGRPAPINRKVLSSTVDPRVTLEIDRFNLEVNSRPVRLAGRPFAALADELEDALGSVRRAAAQHQARVVTVGILPTLTEADLHHGAITERVRYRALAKGIQRLRRNPPPLHIQGEDELSLDCADIAYEGANTSFQVHLRVPPSAFARTYNAAQIATAPVLAASVNSPLFLGRRLWDETRVALFKQATDDRDRAQRPPDDDWRPARVSFGHGWVRTGAYELFAEIATMHEPLLPVIGAEDPLQAVRRGDVPKLAELRLHNGTVWRWNRAVYDDADGGHLRVELRALPSGPTVNDMIANAAFLVGLTLALAPRADEMMLGLTFGHTRRNFYEAAQRGLGAEFLWPDQPGRRVHPISARELLPRLFPLARAGLVDAGVTTEEADRWLKIVQDRVMVQQTGASWQRQAFDRLRGQSAPDQAARALLSAYMKASDAGAPVHTWPLP